MGVGHNENKSAIPCQSSTTASNKYQVPSACTSAEALGAYKSLKSKHHVLWKMDGHCIEQCNIIGNPDQSPKAQCL
eukprot:3954470-Amphidinium_carterae.2